MKRVLISMAFLCMFSSAAGADDLVKIKMLTSQGEIQLALNNTKAPITVANMLAYIEEGYYKNTVFHRVIKGFMAQGGGYDQNLKPKNTHKSIKNEADNGLKNNRGTIAMARTSNPDSATSQFFINLVDNAFLNHTSKTMRGWGYVVFGRVTDGMDVVDRMAAIPTGPKGPFSRDVPQTPVIIKDIFVVK